ncbi:MAG: DUF4136 domain-containing protein [Thermoanaerobaculia bacterium]
MKRVARLAGCPWWLPLLLLSLACSAIRVNHEYDSAADFSRFHSFTWKAGANLPPGSPIPPGSDLDLRFKHAIEGQLVAAGLRPAADGKPDLYVAYYAYRSDTLELTGVDYKLAPGVHWVGDPSTHTERSYTEGTLEVDLVDAATNTLVWRGTAMAGEQSLAALRNRIDPAVKRLFRGYPPHRK